MKSKLSPNIVKQAAKVLRCIGHPDRLRLVECLEGKKLSVNDIMRMLRLDQVSVSKHLGVLKKNRVVISEAEGNFRLYSIAYPNVINVLNCMRKHGSSK